MYPSRNLEQQFFYPKPSSGWSETSLCFRIKSKQKVFIRVNRSFSKEKKGNSGKIEKTHFVQRFRMPFQGET
jgi:hypothetical protein